MRRVQSKCRATIGQLGNLDWINVSIGKAGRSRHMGIRPHTRAKAMNPIDHPLGGGEGRSNGGRHPVSKTGVPAKGGITRQPAQGQREADPASPQVRHAPAASADGERVRSCSCQLPVEGRHSLTTGATDMSRSAKKGPFVDEKLLQEGLEAEREPRQAAHQDLGPGLHDHPGVRRPYVRSSQREQVPEGVRAGRHGRPQARRIFADADVPRPQRSQGRSRRGAPHRRLRRLQSRTCSRGSLRG